MKPDETRPSERPAEALVGRYLIFRKPMLLPFAMHIDPCIYQATGVRNKRQLLLTPVGTETKPRKWTRLGTHIAFSFAERSKAEQAVALITKHCAAVAEAEVAVNAALQALGD